MIEVSKNQLREIEYLIQQSMQGNHVLFDTDTVRRVLGPELTQEEAYAAEPLIERLMQEPTLAGKRAYLERLGEQDELAFSQVVRTYFCIVENNLLEKVEVRH